MCNHKLFILFHNKTAIGEINYKTYCTEDRFGFPIILVTVTRMYPFEDLSTQYCKAKIFEKTNYDVVYLGTTTLYRHNIKISYIIGSIHDVMRCHFSQ